MDIERRGLLGLVASTTAVASIPSIAQAKTDDEKLAALRELLGGEIEYPMRFTTASELIRAYRAVLLGLIEVIEERDRPA